MNKKVNMILAADVMWGVGTKDGRLLANLTKDLKYFKSLTEGNVVIMGRKTYESLPDKNRPLPNRVNIVVSKSLYPQKDLFVVKSIEEAIDFAKTLVDKEIFIIGGGSVYDYCLKNNLVNKMYLTLIHYDFSEDSYDKEEIVYLDQKQINQIFNDNKISELEDIVDSDSKIKIEYSTTRMIVNIKDSK